MDATCARELKRIGLATRVGIIRKAIGPQCWSLKYKEHFKIEDYGKIWSSFRQVGCDITILGTGWADSKEFVFRVKKTRLESRRGAESRKFWTDGIV